MIFSTKNSNYKEEVGFDTKDLSQLEDIKNRITFTDAFSTSSNDLIINGELVIENLTIVNRIGNTDISKTVVKGVRIAEKQLGKPLFVN